MVRMPEYTLVGAEGPVRLVDIFDGRSQLIVYNHMWDPDAEWQCGGCTSLTSSFTRLDFLDNYDARFVIVTQGPIEAALAYARRVGNTMTWYSTADSPFGADVDAPPGGVFALNLFLRDGETVDRILCHDTAVPASCDRAGVRRFALRYGRRPAPSLPQRLARFG